MRSLNGGWSYSWQGERTNTYAAGYNTILEALQNKFGKDQVRYSPGVVYKPNGLYWEDSIADIAAAVKAAAQVDYIVLCIGENSYTETPGNTEDLSLSRHQQALATALLQTGKKVIVVLNEGRPRIITPIAGAADALLQVYLPGNYGGDALAAILAGEVNPSGKLPYTYPRQVNALIPYIHKPSDEKSKFDDTALLAKEFTPLFPFGYGLSYTSFAYNNLRVDRQQLNAGETLTVTVEVKNTGQREGMETVLLFSSDPVASLTPDVKRLRAFRKILLKAGEQQTVTFRLKADDLAFVHTDNRRHLEAGEFVIRVNNLEQHITVNNTRILP
jgi:beta-glucosidase